MKRPQQLTRDQLEAIVDVVQQTLYLDRDANAAYYWNPEKEWAGAEALDQIADTLVEHELSPQASQPFQPA